MNLKWIRNLLKKELFITLVLIFTLGLFIGCGDVPDEEATEKSTEKEEKKETEERNIPEKFDNEIVGIDPGAEMMETAKNDLMPEYGLVDYELIESSDPAMIAALERAIDREEWIAVLGWTPHWKWAEWDLKFLDDPQKAYGEAEDIRSLARLDFQDDYPEAAELVDNFYVDDEILGELMRLVEESSDEREAIETWAEDNQDLINEWVPEGVDGGGEEISMLYNNWVCAISKTNLVAYMLEEKMNYNVEMTMVDVALLYESLSSGDDDLMVCAWLPLTQASYFEEYGDDLEELGAVYEGGKIGVVVPDYVDIDSIEEMN